MDERFWHKRWETNDIGFHKDDPHHDLVSCFERLELTAGETIFVPLCGKSADLVWLHGQGVYVVGVELSRLALDAFIEENQLVGDWSIAEGMPCWLGQRYKLFCGDIFSLTAADLGAVRATYDRGALVALPEEMRGKYADHLARLLPSGSRLLVISYDYDPAETYGPPFPVPLAEIKELYEPFFRVELLVEEDTLHTHKGMAARGVTRLSEFAVLLTRL